MDGAEGRIGCDQERPAVSEATASSSLRAPIQPTKQMIDDHEVSHLPFRNWCTASVRGRGRSCAHKSIDTGDET
eukprot:10749961-Lingulodinium_polyedra.AAC.1